jgi:uncharacterized membrane protein
MKLGQLVLEWRCNLSAIKDKIYKYPEVLIVFLFTVVACFCSIHLLYDCYRASSFDLGIFTEGIKNTLLGNPLYSNMIGFNQLASHFSPILFLVVPFYWLYPHPQTLLIIQAISLGFGGYLVYCLANYYKLSKKLCLFIEVLYFISPLVWGMVSFDFHEACFAPPFLLLMIIGMLQKKWWLFGVGLVFSLMVKEDIILIVAVFGFVLLVTNYFKNKKIEWRRSMIRRVNVLR